MSVKQIIRTVWAYTVNGEQKGTCTEDYARKAYQSLIELGQQNVQVIRMDHVASDFAKTGKNWTVSTTVELDSNPVPSTGELATPTDDELITAVYMPNGSLGYYGFNGGGPATTAQKNKVRALLAKHAGNPTVEAIRRTLNARIAEGDRIERCDVLPVLSWFRSTCN